MKATEVIAEYKRHIKQLQYRRVSEDAMNAVAAKLELLHDASCPVVRKQIERAIIESSRFPDSLKECALHHLETGEYKQTPDGYTCFVMTKPLGVAMLKDE